ncbi:MAG: UbiD family decarboxylase [Thermoplasmata archaeon]|nr:UbiD family decarboxylase [Thermoplasmata archaeon]
MLEKYLKKFEEDVITFKEAEIQELPEHMKKERKKILYFKDVNGFQVVANLWALRERFKKILGENIITVLLRAIEAPKEYKIRDFDMRSRSFSLLEFPFPKYYPKDGGRYITSGVVFAEYEGKRNASFHRLMLLDDERAAIRLVPRDLYTMHKKAIDRGEEIRIALTIGLEPNVLLAAATSVDYYTEELKIASAIKHQAKEEVEIAMKTPNGNIVPYESEIILEGRITDEYVKEGPFLDITGTYDLVREQPVVVFEKFYVRKKPIFHLLLPGGYEHFNLMGMPREPTIYREVKKEGVDVIDVRLTPGGCSWLHGIIKIKKRKEDDGKRAIYGAFRGHGSLKHVVIVDEDIDIWNMEEVEWAIATRFQGDRDLIKLEKVRGSSLDPSSYEGHLTTKLGLDATAPIDEREKFRRFI